MIGVFTLHTYREQVQLEAKRAERERAEAKQAEREAKEKKVCKEEERHEAEKGDEASTGASSSKAGGEVNRVVMDPNCTCCTQVKVICEFLMNSNKKQVACVQCNQSKGKCQWPRDGKDTKAGPKATSKVDKGKKQKADNETLTLR
ncbi:hypothetical protein M404DRAFT_25159 [Pisolithus tinctorius Marx 270]|uniref:Uncharacterized protein n=1 Tax=Pisolithus tinctorius Marx 270 TaxID=870435 RepID=A0A0C3PDM7_PISTI|nr:hypothetical protein M404DRAFT_25159 [Pisolithus tinctorius Marx 270]